MGTLTQVSQRSTCSMKIMFGLFRAASLTISRSGGGTIGSSVELMKTIGTWVGVCVVIGYWTRQFGRTSGLLESCGISWFTLYVPWCSADGVCSSWHCRSLKYFQVGLYPSQIDMGNYDNKVIIVSTLTNMTILISAMMTTMLIVMITTMTILFKPGRFVKPATKQLKMIMLMLMTM